MKKDKKKILVTGATGFVGANLVRRLVKNDDYGIHILARKDSNKWRISDILNKIQGHTVDLDDYKRLAKTVGKIKPDYIFHLAAYGGYPTVQTDIDKIIKTNFTGTVNLIKASSGVDYECFVNSGSSSEYGLKDHPMVETDLLEPVNVYGASKAASTLFCQTIARTTGKPILTLRLFSVYGYYEEPIRLVPTVINHYLNREELDLTEGYQRRDFIFVEDVIDTYIKAMSRPDLGGEILNVGSGRQYTIKEVVVKIRGIMNSRIGLNWGKKSMRSFEPTCWVSNTDKTMRLLKWKPKHTLHEGLEKTIRWFEGHKELYKAIKT